MTCNISLWNRLQKREWTSCIRSSKRFGNLSNLEIENWETPAHDLSAVIRLWYNLILAKIKQGRSQVLPGAIEWADHFSSKVQYFIMAGVKSWFEWRGRDESLISQSRLMLLIGSGCWMFQTGLASKLCSKKIWTEKLNILCENPCFEIYFSLRTTFLYTSVEYAAGSRLYVLSKFESSWCYIPKGYNY